MAERIQKVLASAGIASRREVEKWIKEGRIKVNGKVAALGDKISKDDRVFVNGRRVALANNIKPSRRVLVYHKREGEICTRSDPQGRPSVYRNLPKIQGERWVAVGRLDINTSGLLLFTNDGDFANQLMHPSSEVPREYAVRIRGDVSSELLDNLREGVLLDDGVAKFNDIVESGGEGQNSWFHVVLLEGKNREVRRLWESQGVTVSRLKRVRYGTIVLTQKVRQSRFLELNDREIKSLEEILPKKKSSEKVSDAKKPAKQAKKSPKKKSSKKTGKASKRARKK